MIIPEEFKDVDFLRDLGKEHLNQVAMMATLKEYEPGAVVFRQGDSSKFIYIVLSGNVSLHFDEPSGEVEISTLGPGELLGWSPVLGRHSMSATAQAVTRGRLAVLDVNKVLDLCERDAKFGVAFLLQIGLAMSNRLWALRRNLARVLSHRPLDGGSRLSPSD